MTPDTQALKEAAEKTFKARENFSGHQTTDYKLAMWESAKNLGLMIDEISSLIADNERLREALKTVVDFHNLPVSSKRPDIWQRVLSNAAKALEGE